MHHRSCKHALSQMLADCYTGDDIKELSGYRAEDCGGKGRPARGCIAETDPAWHAPSAHSPAAPGTGTPSAHSAVPACTARGPQQSAAVHKKGTTSARRAREDQSHEPICSHQALNHCMLKPVPCIGQAVLRSAKEKTASVHGQQTLPLSQHDLNRCPCTLSVTAYLCFTNLHLSVHPKTEPDHVYFTCFFISTRKHLTVSAATRCNVSHCTTPHLGHVQRVQSLV